MTGGYLVEIDQSDGETFLLTSPEGLPIGIADPSAPTSTQSTCSTSAFVAADNAMYGTNFTDPSTGWQGSWDEAPIVNWFLVEELAGNEDANDHSSDYSTNREEPHVSTAVSSDMNVTLSNNNYTPIQSPSVPWVSTQAKW